MTTPLLSRPFFFVGIGGSGMLPLAAIVQGLGAQVSGSDRSYDQGRTPEKFAWMARKGFRLFPQDGSGVTSGEQVLVASAAIEDTVPEVARANALGCERMSRAELLSALFNDSPGSIGIAGTSGKSTTTGMLGWIMAQTGRAPTIMNGAVMKNFVSAEEPFASAVVGGGQCFVSEVDESDGSIALYRPSVAVLLNVSLDHKSMAELRVLFGDFLAAAGRAAVNVDDAEARALLGRAADAVTFGIDSVDANISVEPGSITGMPTNIAARIVAAGAAHDLALPMPGRHNLANALAAVAGAHAAGVPVADAVRALHSFKGSPAGSISSAPAPAGSP